MIILLYSFGGKRFDKPCDRENLSRKSVEIDTSPRMQQTLSSEVFSMGQLKSCGSPYPASMDSQVTVEPFRRAKGGIGTITIHPNNTVVLDDRYCYVERKANNRLLNTKQRWRARNPYLLHAASCGVLHRNHPKRAREDERACICTYI